MSDNDQPAAGASSTENRSGGVNVDAQQVNIGGDVVGRDKIVQTVINEASAPIATSLHQLPPPPRDFTGREAELAELMAKAEADGITISGVQGMGGVGKTALALVLAERLKPRYPDAQFYLDLKGADKQPLSVAAALTHVIRAYHPTAQLPDSEAELRGLYLSVLEGQRALLLMDNAANRTQVELLIPPSSCFLLVTSRQHFTLPGLFAKDLNTLPPNDARDLLLKIAPRIDGQADALAKLCGYLPLALRLAGSALAERRTLTLENYVKRLQGAQTRLELVEASFNLSYNLLTDDLQKAWCALSVFPDTFDLDAASVVWDIEQELAEDTLDALMRYSLIDWNETDSRVHLHNLALLFADKRLNDAIRLVSQRRHAAYYTSVLRKANDLYNQGGDGVLRGLGLFDLERANIEVGQAWAVKHTEIDDMARELCSEYPNAGLHMFALRQHPRERIRLLEAALVAARLLKRRNVEGWHLGNLALAYNDLGEYRHAVEYHEQALAIAREISDRQSEAGVLANLGSTYNILGEYRHAVEYHEQALAIAREISDRQTEGQVLSCLGTVYNTLSEYRRAIEYHEQALAIARELGDRRSEATALGELGIAYKSLGEYHHDIECQEQSLTIACEISDRRSEAAALGNLGAAYILLGEYRRAIEYLEKALTIVHEIAYRQAEGIIVGNLGGVYYWLGEYRHAIEYFQRALAIASEIGDQLSEGNALNNLAVCFNADNDRPQAIVHAQAALDKYTAIKSPGVQKVGDLLAKLHE